MAEHSDPVEQQASPDERTEALRESAEVASAAQDPPSPEGLQEPAPTSSASSAAPVAPGAQDPVAPATQEPPSPEGLQEPAPASPPASAAPAARTQAAPGGALTEALLQAARVTAAERFAAPLVLVLMRAAEETQDSGQLSLSTRRMLNAALSAAEHNPHLSEMARKSIAAVRDQL